MRQEVVRGVEMVWQGRGKMAENIDGSRGRGR